MMMGGWGEAGDASLYWKNFFFNFPNKFQQNVYDEDYNYCWVGGNFIDIFSKAKLNYIS